VIAVPLQAIVEKPATPAPSPAATGNVPAPTPADKPKDVRGVYVLQNNKVKFVPVETGITGESDIQILSGVQENMEVITGPSRVLKSLKDDMKVKRQTTKAGESGSPGGEK
jgi:HlyD family secretion protein